MGVSGIDAGFIKARRRPPVTKEVNGQKTSVDYGLVGDVVSVDATVLQKQLDAGFMPVVSPLCADESGQVLNVNADTIAATVAREMGAEKLIFITDTAGLLEDKSNPASLVSYTDVHGLARLQDLGAIDSGILPKVKAAKEALLAGVKRVHMVGYRGKNNLLVEIFTNEGSGTLIVKDTSELLPSEQAASLPVAGASK
jgi:acetylglutamate kinase